jgi:hypothetical protein
VLYAQRSAVHWVHRRSPRARISSTPARPFAQPFPRARLSPRDHPSRTPLLFRAPSRHDLARLHFRGVELDLPRFRPSSRLHPTASTHREASHGLASFRPQAFAASRRLSPRSGLQACFIPLPRPGLACSGCSSLAQPSSLIDPSRAPLPLIAPRSPTEIGCHVERPRLRGFDPREIAFARLSYSPRRASLPSSGFVSSRSSLFPRCAPVYLVRSTREVTACRLRLRARCPRPSSAYLPREARLVCLQAADLLEFSNLPFENPKTLD